LKGGPPGLLPCSVFVGTQKTQKTYDIHSILIWLDPWVNDSEHPLVQNYQKCSVVVTLWNDAMMTLLLWLDPHGRVQAKP